LGDPKAREILRVWAGSKQLLVSLSTAWADPGHWGIVIADIAHHAANAYAESGEFTKEQAAARIKAAFAAEWDEPTDQAIRVPIQ